MRAGGNSTSPALRLAHERAIPAWIAVLVGLAATQLLLVAIHIAAFELTADAASPSDARQPFDFNQENSLPTLWSALVMLSAGVAAALVATRREGKMRLLWSLVGAGFVWLAFEEQVLQLHEDSQLASGVDWPVIYLPALVGGVILLRILARDAGRFGGLLLLVGVGVMAAAVGTELLSSPSIAIDYDFRNLIEENLELAGVGLVCCGALAALRRA